MLSVLHVWEIIVVAMGAAAAIGSAQTVTLYDKPVGWDQEREIEVEASQRCYSFSCFTGLTSLVRWQGLEEDAYVVFYTKHGCNSTKTFIDFGSSGAYTAREHNVDKQIQSLMVLETSKLPNGGGVLEKQAIPLRGIVDVCPNT